LSGFAFLVTWSDAINQSAFPFRFVSSLEWHPRTQVEVLELKKGLPYNLIPNPGTSHTKTTRPYTCARSFIQVTSHPASPRVRADAGFQVVLVLKDINIGTPCNILTTFT